MKELVGERDRCKGLKIGIVVSSFNGVITEKLLSGALETLAEHNVLDNDITVVRVPGSFEIPAAAQQLLQTYYVDAVVCLGAVVRGETPHFDYISMQVSRGITDVGLRHGLPITFGVITADTVEQAINRSSLDPNLIASNKGVEAATAALEMAGLFRQLTETAERDT